MLKDGVRTIVRRGVHYVLDERGRPRRHRAWLGDSFAFLYDWLMAKSVFPNKLAADRERHFAALALVLADVHGKRILDIAAGTGSLALCLPSDNAYWGTDVSPGLLRRARIALAHAGIQEHELYVAPADDLPFADGVFDLAVCSLAINFLANLADSCREWFRVLGPQGYVVCTVPVPERHSQQRRINGILRREDELRAIAARTGFAMETLPVANGAILYFVLKAHSA